MTAVSYQCYVLSILNNIVNSHFFLVLVPHSVLTNLWFTLSLNTMNQSVMWQDLFMNV